MSLMVVRSTAKLAAEISGDKPYQQQARRALPLLVRQASIGQKILYGDLAEELGMPNPRNLNYVLGSIGRALMALSAAWKTDIPPIQCLVVAKRTGLPGEGIDWFLSDVDDFPHLSSENRRKIVDSELSRIYSYTKWAQVLKSFDLLPVKLNVSKEIRAAEISRGGAPEGAAHRELKKYVAENPTVVGLSGRTLQGQMEYALPSGDSLDVSFLTSSRWTAVEVKSEISSQSDIVRGIFQCVKYKSVMMAVQASEGAERTVRVLLVLQGKFPTKFDSIEKSSWY